MRVASRLAALVVAVGLILAAVTVRDRSTDGATPIALGDGNAVVRCPSDLGALCAGLGALDGIDVSREQTAAVASMAGGQRLEGTWLTTTSWADVVDDERQRGVGAPLARSEVLATSPVVVVGYAERLGAIAEACEQSPAELAMTCVASLAGSRWADVNGEVAWGRVGIGHAPPDTTVGLMTTATVAAGLAGTDFGARELGDPSTAAAFGAVEDAVRDFTPGLGGHVGALRTTGPSVADLVLALEADVVGIEEPRFGPLTVVASVPTFLVELVVVGDDQDAVRSAADLLTFSGGSVFTGEGWRVDGAPTGTPLSTPVVPTERPDGSSLIALRLVWEDLVG